MKENYYNYMVYGLIIKSRIPIPELPKYSGDIDEDILITEGTLPEDIKEKLRDSYWAGDENNIYCRTIEGMQFSIKEGRHILIDGYSKENAIYTISYLLGCIFSILMAQRQVVAIHGGSVVIDNKGVIITGDSGAGKSTLIATFKRNGYKFMSDDFTTVDFGGKNIKINSSFPIQRLCPDTMENFDLDKNDYQIITGDFNKYSILDKDNFLPGKKEVVAMVHLVTTEEDTLKIREIKGHEKLKVIMDNIYRRESFKLIKLTKEYFDNCTNLSKYIRIFEIERPKNKYTSEEQLKEICKLIK